MYHLEHKGIKQNPHTGVVDRRDAGWGESWVCSIRMRHRLMLPRGVRNGI